MAIRALVFDAYGTLYDVQSVRDVATKWCGGKGELITQLWRLKQLEYTWLHALMRSYEDFAQVTSASLEFTLAQVGVEPTPDLREALMSKYLDLDLYPDSRAALTELSAYRLAILSNGSPAMLEALVRNSGLASLFAEVISVDRARSFKPDPKCYALAPEALGVAPEEILFVSSNGFDVAGAKQFGFKVAWIERGRRAPPLSGDVGPAEFYRLLRGGAERLGRDADVRIGSLAELPGAIAELEK